MERTTERLDGWVVRNGCRKSCYACNGVECAYIYPMIDRLASYEDIGTPEEINRIIDAYGRGLTLRTDAGERLEIVKDIPTERLMEIAQAEAALKKREEDNETN